MKSLTNCENPYSNPLQDVCYVFPRAACDSKVVAKAACDPENCSESHPRMYTAENQLMREMESRNRTLMLS
jgi:hypothetical protein